MTQEVCDICGKPIVRNGRKFRIKELRGLFLDGGFIWEEIDAHDECVKMLIQAKQKQEKVGPDR